MDLSEWTYLFPFGRNFFVYAKGKDRVGVDKEGRMIVQYRMDAPSKRNPRCKECLASRIGGSNT